MDAKYARYELAFQNSMWYDVVTGDILTPESAHQLVALRQRIADSDLRIVGTYAKQLRSFMAAHVPTTVEKTRGLEVKIIDRWNETHMAITARDEQSYSKLSSLLEACQIPAVGYTFPTGKSLVAERKHRAEVLTSLRSAGVHASYQNREVIEQGWRNEHLSTSEHEVIRKGQDRFFQMAQDGVTISLLFDGHGNNNVINYITAHKADFMALGLRSFPESNAEAFERAQRVFVEFENRMRKAVDGLYSGSTIVAVVHDVSSKSAFFAQAGDSRAVWQFEKGGEIFSTLDHKPTEESEMARIVALGGKVTRAKGDVWRVNDYLSTSRSFGDEILKERGDDRSKDIVSIIPSVYGPFTFGTGSFYGIGSDGVFDVLSDGKVVEIIRKANGSQNGAQEVTSAAVQAGSRDDITFACVLVT